MTEKGISKIERETNSYLGDAIKGLVKYNQTKCDTDRFVKGAMMCIVNNSALRKCLQTDLGKGTLYQALTYAMSTGLSLNPQEQKAFLIPYGDKIQYQVGKAGMIEMALNSELVEVISSESVKKNDTFAISKATTGDVFTHTQALENRGETIGYYAYLILKTGRTFAKWITKEEAVAHMKRYGKGIDKPGSAWKVSFDGMAEKTVIKALLRSTYINDNVSVAISIDDAQETVTIIQDGQGQEESGTSPKEAASELKNKNQTEKKTSLF